jgi:membrane-associated phospholipid phosphatase
MKFRNSSYYFQYLALPICLLLASTITFGQVDSTRTADSSITVAQADTLLPKTDSVSYYRINGRYLKSFWPSFKSVIKAPGRWDGDDWLEFGIVMGTAGAMFAGLDKPVGNFFKSNTATFWDGAEDVFYPLGNRFPPLLLTGMYVGGVIFRDRKLEHNTLVIAKSLVVSTIFYTASKALIRRERPDRTENSYNFTTPFRKNDYTSFPSGHSNTAFSVATGFAMLYKHKKWVPWVAYSIASLTSISRVYQNRHWASDIIIGAAIGHYVTKTVIRAENKRNLRKRSVPVIP